MSRGQAQFPLLRINYHPTRSFPVTAASSPGGGNRKSAEPTDTSLLVSRLCSVQSNLSCYKYGRSSEPIDPWSLLGGPEVEHGRKISPRPGQEGYTWPQIDFYKSRVSNIPSQSEALLTSMQWVDISVPPSLPQSWLLLYHPKFLLSLPPPPPLCSQAWFGSVRTCLSVQTRR